MPHKHGYGGRWTSALLVVLLSSGAATAQQPAPQVKISGGPLAGGGRR